MLSRLWAENKRFILIAGSGLAVFLILNGILGGYLARVDGVLRKASLLEKDSRALLKDLKRYWDEKSRLSDYEKHEAQLRGELELPPEKEIDNLDKAAPLVQFNQAIDRAWGLAREKANQAAVAIPEKLGPQDFGVEKGDSDRDYERHYAYLGVIRRALHALIDAGMAEISRPELIQEDLLRVIPDDDGVSCMLRAVRFRVAGSYDSFIKVLKALQAPQSFIQVNIGSLAAKGAGDDRTVKGDLEFTTFRLVEGAEAAKDARPAPKSQNRPKRAKR